MKKTLLSIIAISAIVSFANAADTTVITKATVKLIKQQREMKQDINNLKSRVVGSNSQTKKLKKRVDFLEKRAKANKKKVETLRDKTIPNLKSQVNKNKKAIGHLQEKDANLQNQIKKVKKQQEIDRENNRVQFKSLESKIKKLSKDSKKGDKDLLKKIAELELLVKKGSNSNAKALFSDSDISTLKKEVNLLKANSGDNTDILNRLTSIENRINNLSLSTGTTNIKFEECKKYKVPASVESKIDKFIE